MSQIERYAQMLRETGRSGVYHLPAAGVEDLLAAAATQGMVVRDIDLSKVRDKHGFLDALARGLDFPEWFGHNWDALEDCLGDLSWLEGAGWLIVLRQCDAFAADTEDFSMAMAIFTAVAEMWRDEGLPFWTLVDMHADGLAWLPALP